MIKKYSYERYSDKPIEYYKNEKMQKKVSFIRESLDYKGGYDELEVLDEQNENIVNSLFRELFTIGAINKKLLIAVMIEKGYFDFILYPEEDECDAPLENPSAMMDYLNGEYVEDDEHYY